MAQSPLPNLLNYDTIGAFTNQHEASSSHQTDNSSAPDSSLINYILSGAFSRDVSRGVRYGHIGQGSYTLLAENAHLILAEALIQSGTALTDGYCKGCIQKQRDNSSYGCKVKIHVLTYLTQFQSVGHFKITPLVPSE